MDPGYAAQYGELYRRHWWWRAREDVLLSQIGALVPSGGIGSILDIGCGAGLLFNQLAAFGAPEGVEPDPAFREEIERCRFPIHSSPFDDRFDPGKRYGMILMLDVLEHLPDDVTALRHALALLRDDGILLVTVPAFKAIWTALDDLNRHVTRYTRPSFRRVAEAAGMEVKACRYFFHWLFFAKLLVHFKEKLIQPVERVPRIPPQWLNRAMFHLCRIEQKAVSPSMPLPIGSSLLAWGTRKVSR